MNNMEALKINNVSSSFANFCIALEIRFAYSYGAFYVFGTSDPDKFRAYCKKNGFAKSEDMVITSCDFNDIDF